MMHRLLKDEEERANLLQHMLDEQDGEAHRQTEAQKRKDAKADAGLRKLLEGAESLWLVCMAGHACSAHTHACV